ncbi:voltage-gated ion channel protein, putative [Bodo saltans]|uniref:Voltage-gated ion channel protein, putative n=1 Tax=Bodo saltans TaxID=75058 RepID=A0A0S4J9N6_BODSA|nr:voltage-gated ion channel protein, putative [Bodo saltans]|eukprot:CUG88146.1 voltage-gated ion channel protein, putative [Bodo saltans]
MVVGQFFAVNLFIGVLVDRFLDQRRRGEGHALLTPTQQQWILVQKVLFRAEVRGEPQRPPGWRSPIFSLCSHWLFDLTMYILIAANSVLLSAYYYDMTQQVRNTLDTINIILISLFTLEIVLKCIAFGPFSFFGLLWNRLDVFVVALSWIGVALGNQSAVVGVFRVSRLLMLLRKMKGLQTLFVTLYHAIPEFLNVALVLMVLYFVFAIIGVQLFSNVPRGETISMYINFEHAGTALITLYIMMTQESWGDVTDELARNSTAAIPFSVTFMVIVSWVAINLLVTVVIDVFGEAEATEKQDASLRVIDHFRQVWCTYDPNGSKLLPVSVVLRILPTMPSSIWDRSPMKNGHSSPWVCVLRQLERLHIPVDPSKRVRYEDCIGSLALRLFSLSTSEAIHVSQSTIHGVSWQQSHFSIHHEFAALMISRTYRRYQASRRERLLETQVRTLRDQHAIVVETELQPLRKAYHEAINLIRWMAARENREGAAPAVFAQSLNEPIPSEDAFEIGRRASGASRNRDLLEPDDYINDANVEIVFGADDDDTVASTPPFSGLHQDPTVAMEASMGAWTMSILEDSRPSR